jgi:hypothetical protein
VSSATTVHELKTLVLSYSPAIAFDTVEEERVEALADVVAAELQIPVYTWAPTRGIVRKPTAHPSVSGRYDDEYMKSPAGWRFAARYESQHGQEGFDIPWNWVPRRQEVAMSARRSTQRPPAARVIHRRSAADERRVERLRKICTALPEANEKLSHGEPTWFAGKGKVFAMLDDHHHGSGRLAVWLPQPLGAQEALIDADPVRFFRPPYVGVSGWVGVALDAKPDWGVIAGLVRQAYRHVATKKLEAKLVG